MRQRAIFATLAAALTVGGVVVGTSATTFAWFSDTASGTDSRVGTATVELGDGGGTVELGYTDLRPGRRQVVDLTISYQGTVPADVTLEIAPSGESALCVQRKGRWQSRPGGAVTVKVGTATPVSYCELLNGQALLLASAVPPGSERHIDVAVMLSKDAKANMRGLAEKDVATVRARGGFTDHAGGTISITTAGRDKDKDGDRREDGQQTRAEAAGERDTKSAAIPGGAPNAPNAPNAPTSGAYVAPSLIALPVECEQAGMRLDGFEDVIVLDPGRHSWNALEQRGKGAGPFLVVGSDGDDEIVGSEGADCIVGGEGWDRLAGGAGDDVLIGDAGADLLDGGPGNDWLLGGSDVDDLRGGGGIDRFDGGPAGRATSPTTASPPTTTSPPMTTSPSTATSPTTTTSSPTTTSPSPTTAAAPGSAIPMPPTTSTAQADGLSDGMAEPSIPSGTGEAPSADPTEASAPPNSPLRREVA